ncbi:MAG: hypothetical protein J6U08_00725 [Paludibacteraceae bacterium]|nr:hypothetical protein [Paludibacteraceae bacterium]
MKIYIKSLSICTILLLAGCNAKVSTQITKAYLETDVKQEIKMVKTDDLLPENTEVIGKVKVGDKGATATSKCTYPKVIEKAKEEARKAGGNAIRITQHKVPDFRCTCHRIKADILRIENVDSYLFGMSQKTAKDLEVRDSNYAVLNIYRPHEIGLRPAFNLHLGDVTLCRVPRDYKKTVLVKTDSISTLWIKTESKEEISADLKPGHVYFLRCEITTDAFTPRTSLSLSEGENGMNEFQAFNVKEIDPIVDTFEIVKGKSHISYGMNPAKAEVDSVSSNGHAKEQKPTEPQKIVFAINGGYSRRIGKIAQDVPRELVDHMKSIKNGFHVEADFYGFFSEMVGAGAKLAFFDASDAKMVKVNNTYDNSFSYVKVNDKYAIPLLGPTLTSRFLSRDLRNAFMMTCSIGYMGYTNRGEYASSKYKITGNAMYASVDFGYDHWMSQNVAVGFKISLIGSSLSKYTLEQDGKKEEVKLEKDKHESLTRIDFSIGMRFGK